MFSYSIDFILSIGEADFAIANVQCQYDSPSDHEETEAPVVSARPADDHTYDTRDEPPAFIIRQVNNQPAPTPARQTQFADLGPKIMTLGPGCLPSVNVIHVGDRPHVTQQPIEYTINKRIRRSEELLLQAADCVSRGHTFQTVSEQFNIPISTIRFFMARKGILPKRRRGRSNQMIRSCSSPEPLFQMQHFKLPDMIALKDSDEEPQ